MIRPPFVIHFKINGGCDGFLANFGSGKNLLLLMEFFSFLFKNDFQSALENPNWGKVGRTFSAPKISFVTLHLFPNSSMFSIFFSTSTSQCCFLTLCRDPLIMEKGKLLKKHQTI